MELEGEEQSAQNYHFFIFIGRKAFFQGKERKKISSTLEIFMSDLHSLEIRSDGKKYLFKVHYSTLFDELNII